VKKVVATVLENIPFNNEGIWGRKEFKKRARNELDHIIALTQRTKEALLLEGADEKKITMISHAINTKRFSPIKNYLENVGRMKKNIHILFSGRLEVYKGIYEILYSAKLLLIDKDLQNYSLSFTFVGEGSEKGKMIQLEKKLNIQKSIKHISVSYGQMPAIYQTADIFVAPSKPTATYQEQYCTALLEAQASALPIVTTFSGGIPENVGNAAVMVGPGDVHSLKDAIKDYILNPSKRAEYAKRARERAETVHSTEVVARKMDMLYQSLL